MRAIAEQPADACILPVPIERRRLGLPETFVLWADLGVSFLVMVVGMFLVPFFGTLIYLIARPTGVTPEERELIDEANRVAAGPTPEARAFELQALADLHDRGKLTDEEFAAEKARVLGA